MLSSALKAAIEMFIEQEKLPASYAATAEQWFVPVMEEILHKTSTATETLVVGVSGCQGSGKSTLAGLLVIMLKESMGLNCINLSLDDFYLTLAERQKLSTTVHPLLLTRGVPGTHDVELAINTIEALKQAGTVPVPRFDKSVDDRSPEEEWPHVQGPVDVIVLEGWCLSIGAEPEASLQEPTNELEAQEDTEGVWRSYVNQIIKDKYQSLYEQIDFLIMLKAPAFEKVFEWRQNQEDKLIEKLQKEGADTNSSKVMNKEQLKRFIHHYERVTRHGLKTLPTKADVVFELTEEQGIASRL